MTPDPRALGPRISSERAPGSPDYRTFTIATTTLLIFGILVRCVQFVLPRSLWFDEARNALDILNPHWLEMLPPHALQPSPFGFFVVERLATQLLGDGEWALRALPFAAGIGALLLGTYLARRTLQGIAVPIAVGLLALSGPAIYFGSELKPYATDLFVFLGIAALLLRSNSQERAMGPGLIGLAFAGALGLWLSYTAVFLLAVGGPWLFFDRLQRGDRRGGVGLVAVGSIWIASFALHYVLVISHWSNTDWLNQHWRQSFAPTEGGAGDWVGWGLEAFTASFENPLGLAAIPASIAAAFFILGAIRAVARPNHLLLLFLASFVLVFGSSLIQLYPFHGRLLLFLVPALAFLVAHGVEGLLGQGKRVWLAAGLAAFLLAHPASMAAGVLAKRPLHGSGQTQIESYEGIRWVIPYLKPRWRPGDIIYLYHGAEPEYRYYARQLGFRPPFVVGVRSTANRERYVDELETFRGEPRVWILFAHAIPGEHTFFLEQLDAMGKRLDGVERPWADAHLYDLSAPPSRTR